MKYPTQVSILVFVVYALTACGPGATADPDTPTLGEAVYEAEQTQARSDFVLYQDQTYQFELQLPREWYVGDVSKETYGIVATNTDDASQPRALVAVVAEPIGSDFDLEQGFQSFTDSFKSQPGVSEFRSEGTRNAVVNGLPGREAYLRYMLEGIEFRHRAVVLQAADTFYGISYVAPDTIFAGNESLFNSVLPTFKGE